MKTKLQQKAEQPFWQRFILLIILGYEALGCFSGGILLIAAPDGRYMDMPVDLMHGAFTNFLIPGLVLFGLGIISTLAFLSVLRKDTSDWFFSGMALGGLFVWFWVEIAILRELHWLHAMWALPVLLGWVFLIPLIASRHKSKRMQNFLLACGAVSSIWYLIINSFVPQYYTGYSSITYTVSELSAIDAPTRILWVLLAVFYPLLYIAFGWGVLQSMHHNRHFRFIGILVILYGILNFYWPPMHTREVIALGGSSLTDTLHITWAMITLVVNVLLLGWGAAAMEKGFRIYTAVTFIIFIVFGILIFNESPGIEKGLATPFIGLWERINIGTFMLWIAVLSVMLLRMKTAPSESI